MKEVSDELIKEDSKEVESEIWITTFDNPFNPFSQFESWKAFDELFGYKTLERIAKICLVSENLSEKENEWMLDAALISLCLLNPFGIYYLVNKKDCVDW